MTWRLLAVAIVVATTVAHAPPAFASTRSMGLHALVAPSESEVERARELYENGRRLFEEGSYEGAILAFERAYELSGEGNLLYNIALAYDRLEQFDRAIEYLDRYRGLAPASERDELRRRRDSLQKRLEKQRARAAEAGERVQDGGDEDTSDDTSEPAFAPIASDTPEPTPSAPRRSRIYGPAAWGLTATAAVGFAIGIGFGVGSVTRANDAQDECIDGLCPTAARADVDASRRHAIVADVGFAVGALAAIGVVTVVAVKAVRAKREREVGTQASRRHEGPRRRVAAELTGSGLRLRF